MSLKTKLPLYCTNNNKIVGSTLFLIAKWTGLCLYVWHWTLGLALNFNNNFTIKTFCLITLKCKGVIPSEIGIFGSALKFNRSFICSIDDLSTASYKGVSKLIPLLTFGSAPFNKR